MRKLLLTLLSMPTVVGLFLPLSGHAQAAEPTKKQPNQLCLQEHGKMYCVRQTRPSMTQVKRAEEIAKNPEIGAEFTDAESDAAIAKFGCDCPACIRAIKQIRVFTGTVS
jgi:hypothetical protein